MAFTVRTILLAVAVILFVISVFVDNPTDWWAWGLAAFAAAFLVRDLGWDRSFGGTTTTRDRDTT
jgi:hypothetical protein